MYKTRYGTVCRKISVCKRVR
jgi:hypothetical protein